MKIMQTHVKNIDMMLQTWFGAAATGKILCKGIREALTNHFFPPNQQFSRHTQMHTDMESGNKGMLKKIGRNIKPAIGVWVMDVFMILITFKYQKLPLVSQFT